MSMSTSQFRRRHQDINSIEIQTLTDKIQTTESERLLGATIHQNLKWGHYLLFDENSLVRQLHSRINAIKKISKSSCFKTRLMIANGIFLSKLTYLIPLWGGCEKLIIRSLQKVQNIILRVVTKRNIFTPVREMLTNCGWLSVHQLAGYHTLLLVHKIKHTGQPLYLAEMFTSSFNYPTRFAGAGNIQAAGKSEVRLELSQQSFKFRAIRDWNKLPSQLKLETSSMLFKKKLKI